jgi:CRP/FNR family transcriptional regulator, nitrogen fixation regulation protein
MADQARIDGTPHFPAPALEAQNPLRALDAVMTMRRYRRGENISGRGCADEIFYRVVSGVTKRFATLANGRQQIVDLLLPGDLFACGPDDQNIFGIEAAAEGTMIACCPRRRVELLATSDPRVAKLVKEIEFGMVYRLEAQLLILGRTTALEKVSAFLLKLSERQGGEAADGLVLPISRYDIADYLALTVETVSRSLTVLKQRGLIKFLDARRIRIVNRYALEDVADMHERTPRHAELHRSGLSSGRTKLAMTARRMASASL